MTSQQFEEWLKDYRKANPVEFSQYMEQRPWPDREEYMRHLRQLAERESTPVIKRIVVWVFCVALFLALLVLIEVLLGFDPTSFR